MIRVHVNQHVIKHNAKHGTKLPTLTVKLPEGTRYAYEVAGEGRIIDANARGRRPLDCGARVWMEYLPATFRFVDDRVLTWPEMQAAMKQETPTAAAP